jgi:azurin
VVLVDREPDQYRRAVTDRLQAVFQEGLSVALNDKGVASSDKYTISGAELICTGVE